MKDRAPRGRKPKKKVCQFCIDKVEHIDYKDTAKLRRFVSERGLTETLKEAMAFRSFGSYRWNYDRLATLPLKRQFMKRWSSELKAMFKNGEMTRRYYSKNRRMRLWLAAYCPFVYYFTKKF